MSHPPGDEDGQSTGRDRRARRERQETVARILDASKAILREGSMFDLTVQTVARRLNLSRPTVYRYFPTVADIMQALSDETIRAIYDNLPERAPSDPRYLDEFVTTAVNVFLSDPLVIRHLVLASAIGRSSGSWYQVDPEDLLRTVISELPEQKRPVSSDPNEAARVLITYFRGALYGWAAGFLSDEDFEKEVRRAVRLSR